MTRRRPHPPDGDARRHARRPIRIRASSSRRRPIVIIPEYKEAAAGHGRAGHHACSPSTSAAAIPAVQDPKLNSHSKLNCITACIQATKAGADEALMLDPHGFVATCNSTHFFIVRKGEVWTSTGDYCLGGITRGNVIQVCREAGIPVFEKNFSLTDVYGARRGVRHRHLRRPRAGARDRRAAHHGRPRPDGRAAAATLQGADRGRRREQTRP